MSLQGESGDLCAGREDEWEEGIRPYLPHHAWDATERAGGSIGVRGWSENIIDCHVVISCYGYSGFIRIMENTGIS